MGRTGLLLALCGSSKNPPPLPPPVDRCLEVVAFFEGAEEGGSGSGGGNDGSGVTDFCEMRIFGVAESVTEEGV